MFSILITTYNNPEYLSLCVDSILNNSYYKTNQLCIHINEYNRESIDYLKSKNIKYTLSKDNIGISAAINLCADRAIYENVLIANDDCYFTSSWDLSLNKWYIELDKLFPKYLKFICYRWIEPIPGSFQPICNAGRNINDFNSNISELHSYIANHCKHAPRRDWLFNSTYPRDVFLNCKYSDEFFPASGADEDFVMKVFEYLKKNNKKFLIFGINDCCVYHFQGRAMEKAKLLLPSSYIDNSSLFKQKWKIDAGEFFNIVHREVNRSIKLIESKSNI